MMLTEHPQRQSQSASAWTMPHCLLGLWGLYYLVLSHDSNALHQIHDLLLALILSSTIISFLSPVFNRIACEYSKETSRLVIMENVLGCIVLSSIVGLLLCIGLLIFSDYFLSSAHFCNVALLVFLLNGALLLSIVLISTNSQGLQKLIACTALALLCFTLLHNSRWPISSGHTAVFVALAVFIASVTSAVKAKLPSPTKLSLSLLSKTPEATGIAVAGMVFCASIWLNLCADLTMHTTAATDSWVLRLHPEPLILANLCLLPITIISYVRLEQHFDRRLSAFVTSTENNGTLGDLKFHQQRLKSQGVIGMQGVLIALCAVTLLAYWGQEQLALSDYIPGNSNIDLVVHFVAVACTMVTLVSLRLIHQLQRNDLLFTISLSSLAASVIVFYFAPGSVHGLLLANALVCTFAVALLYRSLHQFDYNYCVGSAVKG